MTGGISDVGVPNPNVAQVPNFGNLTFAQKLAAFPSDAAGNVVDFVKENPGTSLFAAGLAGTNAYDAWMANKEIKEREKERTRTNNRFAQVFDNPPINLGAYYSNPDFRTPQRPMLVKKGGEIPSKGLGDIVPAMLEPGEFVMTRSAVTGAGNGSQKNGIKRMYSMMKDFERRV
tara:strand:- start:732 stop:1253 length:522 start_codon:yes stop_codon:yes gene_type:complete